MAENKEKEEKVTKEKKETKAKKAETKKAETKTEGKKEKPVKEVKVEDTKKEAEKEVKVEEEVKEVEVEDTVIVDEKDKTKRMINIIAFALILLTIVLGIVLVVKKPSPKSAANDFFNLSIKDPVQAIVKYTISEFDVEVEKEKGKYTTYKIESVGDIEKENGKETVKISYVKKSPNSYKIEQEVLDILEKKEIKSDNEKYKDEFLKELKLLLKQKKDQLEETKDVLILTRQQGERNWIISSDPFI